ncbi:MAG: hypothetical protein GWN58_47415 [Anaerolineae bacterium]|nr:hypothetical protein [Anaerolineae bacterium]
MAYATLAQLKDYLDIGQDTDDVLLQALIDRAQTAIDNYTHRNFEAETETRYFERKDLDESGFVLEVDRDLLTISTLTNGDSDGTNIPNTEYWLVPRNSTPKHGIRLKVNSVYSWEFDTDYWVTVVGTWGYSATAPDDIVQAAIRLAAYYYAQKDSSTFDVTAVVEAGIIKVPQGIPKDVQIILGPYVRQGLA